MKIVNIILRIVLGVMLLVFGFNKFVPFLPPFEFGDDLGAKALFEAFTNSGYIWILVGGLEMVVGLLFVTKKAFPAALLALLPISVNIVLFHAVLNPANIAPALFVATLNIYFIYKNWNNYRHLMQ